MKFASTQFKSSHEALTYLHGYIAFCGFILINLSDIISCMTKRNSLKFAMVRSLSVGSLLSNLTATPKIMKAREFTNILKASINFNFVILKCAEWQFFVSQFPIFQV